MPIWPGSPFDPASPQAAAIANLSFVVLFISLLVFVIVEGALFYTLFRYRGRAGAPVPRQFAGHRALEVTWTLIPAILLAVVFAAMIVTMPQTRVSAAPGDPVRIVATGHQWWWEFEYPDLGIVTANEPHFPVGRPIQVELRSADVIHAFWIPRLNGKTDLIPGKVNSLSFQASAPGLYGGQCTEFCGIQHAWMLMPSFADTDSEWEAWVQTHQVPVAAPVGALEQRGREVFLSKSCVNCHAIAGTGAEARVGPDLSHLGTRRTLGAGVLTNTPENLRAWIREPQRFKPGVRMPDFDLTDEEADALTAYLSSLR